MKGSGSFVKNNSTTEKYSEEKVGGSSFARAKCFFCGTEDYIASEELQNSVNVAVPLGSPLLIKGEPGTGKTMLARSI